MTWEPNLLQAARDVLVGGLVDGSSSILQLTPLLARVASYTFERADYVYLATPT